MTRDAYLDRIAYHGPLEPTAAVLCALQVAHLLAVPFENLSIGRGEPIVLDDRHLFDKVVVRRRGGFCYELNGLFAWLLRSLGFRVAMLAAEVVDGRGGWGPPFDHMALLVALEDRWLADVGFGDSFVEPLRIAPGTVQTQGGRAFRLDIDGPRFVVMRRNGDAPWAAQYRFDLAPHRYEDYADMCRYHQTSPDSHFTRGRICSIATPGGRVTISGSRLIRTTEAWRQESDLADESAYVAALRDHFGVVFASS